MIANYIMRLGILRALLASLLFALVIMAPFAGDHGEKSSWSMLPSLLAPALVPILVLVVLFDIVMSRVVMSVDERKVRYGTVLWTYLLLLFATAIFWGPFYSGLF